MTSPKARQSAAGRPIRVHFFFRAPRPGAAYSIERAFDSMIAALPRDRFVVSRFVCPYQSKGIVRRLLLMLWAAARQGDVNHITGDVDFLGLLMRRKRTLITIHDTVSAHRLKGWRRWLFRLFWLELPLRRAAAITSISEFSRQEIESLVPASTGKVVIVPNCLTVAVGAERHDFNEAMPRILHVGTKPNKNLSRTIEALSGLPCKLTIVGPLSTEQRDLLERGRVAYENHVGLSEPDLDRQYAIADVLVFCSTYEGFGLPILEAQALGCLVVASDLDPMRSVAGRGALLVDPLDPGAIRKAVERLRSEPSLRAKLRAEGILNVERYRPAAVAGQYAAIYEKLAIGPSP